MTSTLADPASDPLSAELLQSIVDTARAIFGAEASSVFVLDEGHDELVFQAVSGRGEGTLIGRRFPANSGIAGWVVMSGEALVIDDLTGNAAFDRGLAESTDYVPSALMAAPLIHGDRILGVLEVLDPVAQSRSSLNEIDLLALFARQAAAALRVVLGRSDRTGEDDRETARQLLASLQRVLDN